MPSNLPSSVLMADRTVQTSQTAFEWPATRTPSVPYQQRHEGRRAGNHDVAVPLQHRPNPDARSPRRTTARSVGIKIPDASNRAGDKIEDDGGEEGQEGRSPRGWLANEHVLVPAQCAARAGRSAHQSKLQRGLVPSVMPPSITSSAPVM